MAAEEFFSNIKFPVKLQKRGICFVGAIRENRLRDCGLVEEEAPPPQKKNGSGAYDYAADNQGHNVVVRWLNSRAGCLILNYVAVEPVEEVKRYDRKTIEHAEVERPFIVRAYNSFIGGIDLHNYPASLYMQSVRSRGWYVPLFTTSS